MNIKTKYKPGDIVFYIYNNAVVQEKVHDILIHVEEGYQNPSRVNIRYKFGFGSDNPTLNERDVYSSLALLKKHIIINKPK